jgi:hypothetical protein
MEQRKITVFTSKEQKKTVIMTSATTLAELKSDLRTNGINYTNMDFFEGVSKTKLMADDSQLPQNVPFKGTTTNELVVMLSDTNKKIKSGATSRVDVYEEIKNKGLQDAIKAHFGRNFTQVPTADLVYFLESSAPKATVATKSSLPQVTTRAEAFAAIKERGLADAVKATFGGRNYTQVATDVLLLFVNGINGIGKVVESVKIAKSTPVKEAKASKPEIKKVETPYSDGEINKMFDGWVK